MSVSLARDFIAAFRPLEKSLKKEARVPGMIVVTPERLIVELNLTPKLVARIKSMTAVEFRWFKPVYAALSRHGLLPKQKMAWELWLKLYRARAHEVAQIDVAPRRTGSGKSRLRRTRRQR
jgi:hypothetical protein